MDQFTPTTPTELARFLADNAAGEKRPIAPVGGRTSLHFGYAPREECIAVSTEKLNQLIDFPARDMTVTVGAGMRIDNLATTLRGERQQLPIDAAQSNRATVGGLVATNSSGPRRFGYGALRDYVIGVSAADARGRLFQSGGRVVKNVAGYDLCKLLIGSLGTLAIITQVTFKLRPIPESSALLWTTFSDWKQVDAVLDRLITSETRPVALEALNSTAAREITAEARCDLPTDGAVLAILVEGTERDAAWQTERLKAEVSPFDLQAFSVLSGEETARLLTAVTEFPTLSDDPLTFQVNLPASRTADLIDRASRLDVSLVARAGDGIVIGHLPDTITSASAAAEVLTPLREFARQYRGNLIILNCEESWKQALPVFGEPEPSSYWMQRIKETLDPDGLLNPGRM